MTNKLTLTYFKLNIYAEYNTPEYDDLLLVDDDGLTRVEVRDLYTYYCTYIYMYCVVRLTYVQLDTQCMISEDIHTCSYICVFQLPDKPMHLLQYIRIYE